MWASILKFASGSALGLATMLATVFGLVAFGAYGQHKLDANALTKLKLEYAQAAAAAAAKAAATQHQIDETATAASSAEIASQDALTTRLHEELAYAPVVRTVARDCVPFGFIRLLDAAATGRSSAGLTLPAGKSDDACAPLTWAAVGRSIVANYYTAQANADQLNRLIALLQAEQKAMKQ